MDEVTLGEAIWIEVLARPHDTPARYRFASTPISIGRAYYNDVVVDDPHVAPHHLRIARSDAGVLVAQDLGTRNGLHVDRERARRDEATLDVARDLRIGTTIVRVRTGAHEVAPEQAIVRSAPHWPIAIACLAGVFALAALDLWLSETGEPKAIRYFTPFLILTAMVAVWTTAWSIVTRVFTGHARFGRHFLIASGGLFAYSLYDQSAEIGAFAWSWTALATSAFVVAWIVFGAMVFAHLLAIHRTRKPLKLGVAIVLAAAGIAMQSLKHADFRSNYGQPVTLKRLEPPALRLVSPQREAAFFTDAEALRAKLDKARTEEPTGEGTADED